jgi:hypothetical protein
MTKKIIDFDQLIFDGKNYLIKRLLYRAKATQNYQRNWRHTASEVEPFQKNIKKGIYCHITQPVISE